MPAFSATAPGKIILVGEHAVVYQQPAIAFPVRAVSVKVYILANPIGKMGDVRVESPAIHLDSRLQELDPQHPLAAAIQTVTHHLGIRHLPAMHIKVSSTIPSGAGFGSSAAVSVAVIRALSAFLGHPLPNEEINQLAYQMEVRQHGTPSGIDNTVITFNRPVYYTRGLPIEILSVSAPVHLVIADSGTAASTREMVLGVRQRYEQAEEQYQHIFAEIGAISRLARQKLEQGPIQELGPLLTQNHLLLKKIGVSTPLLDQLVETAINHGAWGAKLSGSGGGGNIIALVDEAISTPLAAALQAAGAARTLVTSLLPEAETGA